MGFGSVVACAVILSQETRDLIPIEPLPAKAGEKFEFAACENRHMGEFIKRMWRLRHNTEEMRLGAFQSLGYWVSDKERQNENYLKATVRTKQFNAVAWQRRVGERLEQLTLSKHWCMGLARSLNADL
jgi:hypothetical protein